MPQATTFEAAVCAADFLAQQPEVLRALRLQYSLEIEAYVDSRVICINCGGDQNAAVLVDGIKDRLVVRDGWRVETH